MKANIVIGVETIKEIVCASFGVSAINLNIVDRSREIVTPRQVYHYFTKKYTNLSLAEIGKPYNHATVLNSILKVNNRLDTEKEYRYLISEIESKIINYYVCNVDDVLILNRIKNLCIKDIFECKSETQLKEKLIYHSNNL